MSPEPSLSDREAVARLIESAHEAVFDPLPVAIEISPIAPDYRAVRLVISDRQWFQKSQATGSTATFSTVYVMPTPVHCGEIYEKVELHRRLSMSHTGRN